MMVLPPQYPELRTEEPIRLPPLRRYVSGINERDFRKRPTSGNSCKIPVTNLCT